MLIAVGFAGECVSVVRSPEPAGREVLAESAALGPHYQDTWIWIARSWMRLARGDTDGALADQRKSLRSARRALDPQVLCPALSGSAYVLAMAGRAGQAQPVLSEQFGLSLAEGGTLDESSVDFVLAAEILGRLDEARRWLRARRDSPWSVAVRQLADREFAAAAEALDSMGALFADLYQPSREPLCLVAAYSTVTVWVSPTLHSSCSRRYAMCTHQPPCPLANRRDRDAARVVVSHPEQGWSLLCNGVIVFDDMGEILPDGRAIPPHRPAYAQLAAAA